MTTIRNSFEGQTNSTGVTTTNSADSGTAFSAVTAGGGTIAYSTTHPADGALGIGITQSGSVISQVEYNTLNSTSAVLTFCFYYSGAPTATSRIAQLRTAAGLSAGINLSTAGKLITLNSAGTALITATTALTASSIYRVELQVFSDATVGTVGLQYFLGAQSTSAVQSMPSSSVNTRGGAITTVYLGVTTATTFGSTLFLDSIQAQDGSTTPTGPFATRSATLRNATRGAVVRASTY